MLHNWVRTAAATMPQDGTFRRFGRTSRGSACRWPEPRIRLGVGRKEVPLRARDQQEDMMDYRDSAPKEPTPIVESATKARQGERGPSVLMLMLISTGLAILLMAIIWFVWFR
jgi:hypothetical protein